MPSPIQPVVDQLNDILLGKPEQIWLAVLALLARGHVLIEDLPGMGKTTLAQALSAVLGLAQKRVQFTVDVMPGDVLGMNYWDAATQTLVWKNGPVFTEVLLADELNRTTPKTQAALLEAMEERQVTADHVTHRLPEPFFVIATQNPFFQTGTYPLPESQLDRFLVSLSLGYPDSDAEVRLLTEGDRRSRIQQIEAATEPKKVSAFQAEVDQVRVSETLADYVYRLVQHSRTSPQCRLGLSPRGGMALVTASRANAWMEGRDHVLPSDVQRVFVAVASHRLISASHGPRSGVELAEQLLSEVNVVT
ncbi:MAG: AAA family ATPase [Pseudomonadales bacterium]|jgi:MoxR-like ATPase